MEFTTSFNDFRPKDLVGKYVVYVRGHSWDSDNERLKSIRKITKVTKTGFRITPSNNSGTEYDEGLFAFDGWMKGLSGREHMGTYRRCELLTDEEAKALSNEWKERKEKRTLIDEVINLLKDKENREYLTYNQIKNIYDQVKLISKKTDSDEKCYNGNHDRDSDGVCTSCHVLGA